VSWSQIIFGTLLVLLLVLLAGYFGWQQLQSLRRLRTQSLPDDESNWERRKAYRRLISCALLLVMAALLGGLLVFYEPTAERLAEERKNFAVGEAPPFTPEEKVFLRVYYGMWIGFLLALLAVVLLAGMDLWATRRYGLSQYRKLQADRRAMIERQANRMRQERNGH
jgi:ABC-type Fe3+ transport system permease subunit